MAHFLTVVTESTTEVQLGDFAVSFPKDAPVDVIAGALERLAENYTHTAELRRAALVGRVTQVL